ncbi:hypothetical protein HYR69_02545 [Candidatus Sumerlaeota bacterium]|nr:hypothetical protein [Candidatus Sumerlaeota bacterium]MBI3735942.1 hypothetical protein [Candidatus Sumerlaeota bacterium]
MYIKAVMSQVQLNLPLEVLLESCRSLHDAIRYEANAAHEFAGGKEMCALTPDLREAYANLLHQVQSQFPHPFIAGIPSGVSLGDPRQFQALTAQLLAALQCLAAPMLTPETILKAWDNPKDAVYDAL